MDAFSGQTVSEATRTASERLHEAGVDDPQLKAELWVSRVVGCSRLALPLRSHDPLADDQAHRIALGVARLCRHEPIQYVEGEVDFMGRCFHVDPRVLIPRPETEQLVEYVLATSGAWPEHGGVIADVGTGSGCVAVSLALARLQARLVATDSQAGALVVARANAGRLGVLDRVDFRETHLLAGVAQASLDVVVSNPPYVATSDMGSLPRDVREFEPAGALDGGADGLDLVRELVLQAHDRLRAGGYLFMEIGETQGPLVLALLAQRGFDEAVLKQDLAGRVRMVRGKKA